MTFRFGHLGVTLFDIEPARYDRYHALGEFAAGEIGNHLGIVLDGLAMVDDAANGRPVQPWASESFDVTIDASGIRFRNFYAEAVRGDYSLDELRQVLEEYWRFLAAVPEAPGTQRGFWPELPRPEAEVLLWEQVWKRTHPYRGRLF